MTMMTDRRFFVFLTTLCLCLTASAQRFFNLTSDEVAVDTVLPQFGYSVPLQGSFADSVYTASILYPEFIDMTAQDVANYRRLSGEPLPALPTVTQRLALDRRRGALEVTFCPLVYREGKYQILVSFMLRVDASAIAGANAKGHAPTRSSLAASRYADHSVLAQGTWVKIRVPASGVYQLTDALVRQAGFTDASKVKIYGYGGNLQNETLVGSDLQALDDLKEVPTCTVGGKRLFYAKGPVSWSSNTAARRTRNPYSDYGYYFLTQSDGQPATIDEATFLNSFYPSADDYHSLYEVDGYSWYHGGRNLFDPEAIPQGRTKKVTLPNPAGATGGTLSVNVSAGTASEAQVLVGDSLLGTLKVTLSEYDKGNERSGNHSPDGTGRQGCGGDHQDNVGRSHTP